MNDLFSPKREAVMSLPNTETDWAATAKPAPTTDSEKVLSNDTWIKVITERANLQAARAAKEVTK
jgi:hypothetical protein